LAHIRRHPRDRHNWQVRYLDPTGRERSRTFKRKADAEKFLIQIESQIQRSEWIDPGLAATPFDDWATRWLSTRSHLKPKTLAGYESLLRTHVVPRFGNARLDHIDTLSIETWLADLQSSGLSPSRIRQAHQVINAVMKAAVRNRYLSRNPAEHARPPRTTRREMLFLDSTQVDKLAAHVDSRYQTLIYLLAYGGLRWGEAAALRHRRFDYLHSRIEIAESLSEVSGHLYFGSTKNHRSRTIVIPAFLRDKLNEQSLDFSQPDRDGLLFTVNNGSPLRNSNFSKNVWKPALRQTDLPAELRIHDLRHTAAALLISQGAHPEAIKRYLGHSSITVTMDTYGHLFPSEFEAMARALDAVYSHRQTDHRRTNPPN